MNLYVQKGNLVALERAGRRLEELRAHARAS
jgi:hypothetical protein